MNVNGGGNATSKNEARSKKIVSAERDLYMKPLLKLKQQEKILEKGLISAMENMKIETNVLQSILRDHGELNLNRQNFLNAIHRNIESINLELESVKSIAKNPDEIQKLDVNSYKQKLLKLWQKIQDFDKICPLQTLLEEEDALNSEFKPNFQKYEKAQKYALLSSRSGETKMENRKISIEYKDVDDFHALVAATGHTNNWSMEDHLFFLKMRKEYENIPALVMAIKKKCPDLSTEAIVNHESWYKHYENLREKQRQAVKKWRQEKELEKKKYLDDPSNQVANDTNLSALNKTDDKRKTNIVKKNEPSARETKSNNSSASLNNNEKKELIRKWKQEKENKRSMDEEQVKLQMRLKTEMEENKRRKRREKMQRVLQEYKLNKYLENVLKEQDDQLKGKCKYDTNLIKAFRKQDEEFTKKRKDLISRCKQPNKNNLLELKKVELVESRHYSTLMETTKVWREKCKPECSIKLSNELQFIKDIPSICSRWRNEESMDLHI